MYACVYVCECWKNPIVKTISLYIDGQSIQSRRQTNTRLTTIRNWWSGTRKAKTNQSLTDVNIQQIGQKNHDSVRVLLRFVQVIFVNLSIAEINCLRYLTLFIRLIESQSNCKSVEDFEWMKKENNFCASLLENKNAVFPSANLRRPIGFSLLFVCVCK